VPIQVYGHEKCTDRTSPLRVWLVAPRINPPSVGAIAWRRSGATVLAPQVALQFVDWSRLRPAHGIRRERLVCVAAEALDLKIKVSGIKACPSAGEGWAGP
jgi:hypothetical protein